MNVIKIYPEDKIIYFNKGEKLLDIFQENGIILESPCGGKGFCGKCKIRVLRGDVGKITNEELKFLSKEELESGVRLSCLIYPQGDIEIEYINKKQLKHKILSDGYMPKFNKNPMIRKELVKLEKPTLHNNISYEELLEKVLGQKIILEGQRFLDRKSVV